MRILYDAFFILFGVMYVPYLLIKRKYHKEFVQRFGVLPESVTDVKRPVWIHAVSVGEANLAVKAASMMKNDIPGLKIVVSTTTQTGNSIVRSKGEGVVDAVFYFPLDFSAVVAKVVKLIDPRLFMMIETEIWPNLIDELSSKGVPVVMANGRISDSSFNNYMKIRFIMRRVLAKVDLFCMQTGRDAARIKSMGAPGDRVHVTGNMKFDEVAKGISVKGFSMEDLGFDAVDRVIVAGSTHFSEEEALIDVFKELKEKHEGLKLVLAPRHVERSDAIEIYIKKSGIKHHRFSDVLEGKVPRDDDVLLVDTIGHLKDIYGIATLIFVGGSLVKKGGQNPIEGARLGKAVVFGPHMFNFKEVAELFVEAEGAVRADGKDHLVDLFGALLDDDGRRERIALNAERVIGENSGALGRTVRLVEPLLGS